MSQTILIETHPELRKVFTINLQTYTGSDIVERKNAQDTIELLNILPTISLIITQASVGEEPTALLIHNYLENRDLNIPMIVLGEVTELKGKTLCLAEPIEWEVMVKHAANLLGVTTEKLQHKIKPTYTKIPTFYFYELEATPCDVFIRVKKSPTEFQFIKRIHSKDEFNIEVIKKYEAQGLKEFYIPTDYQQYFVNFLTNKLILKLESDIDISKRIETNSLAFDIAKEQLTEYPLDSTLIDFSDSIIKSMISSVKEVPKLNDLLKMLLTSKISYAYQHSHLVSVIGNFILSKQSWYQPRHLEILTFASFFSDITLKSLDQLKINSDEEFQNSNLSQEEKTAVLTHAKDACSLLKAHPKFDDYLKTVILEHHGSKDGVGFVDNPSEDLHPISKVFIIADSFVKIALDPAAPKAKADILERLKARFKNPTYEKIIKVLEQRIE